MLVFAIVALALVSLGTYGVISYAVTQRTRDIGIRLALGARRADVVRGVLADAMRVALAGLVVGVPLAIGAAYGLRSLLFGVGPTDATAIGDYNAPVLFQPVGAATFTVTGGSGATGAGTMLVRYMV